MCYSKWSQNDELKNAKMMKSLNDSIIMWTKAVENGLIDTEEGWDKE